MGTIKNRNDKNLTEAEEIKKRSRIYRKNIQKSLNDLCNRDGLFTHLEMDSLECEVKWVLRSISTNKGSRDDEMPAELIQTLKDDAVKVLHTICHQIWKTRQWSQDWKRSVFIPIPKKNNGKESSNYHTVAPTLHVAKVMLKILQGRLQQDMNQKLSNV